MRVTNFDVFDPKTVIMDSPEDGCDHGNFAFAFNDSNFSDRVLRIYIFSSIESTQSPSAVRVKTLHISSPILAARSPFFYKLFSNGMRESEHYHVNLQINASEEAGLMELLKFMYSNSLTVTNAVDVLDVLMAADKFDVASCIRHCNRLLRNLPMTPESVLVYLNLPSTVLMAEAFQPLTVAAKQFYAVHYKDITKFEDEILSLPLADVESIIASDDLHVKSEDAVYRFVLKWARARYPKTKDRREIIATRLAKFIRYPYMTRRKLTKLLTCKEFDPEFAQKVVTEAISFKAEVPPKQHTYVGDENSNLNCSRFVERAYECRPIKMVELEQGSVVVYMDLKRDLCASLFPWGGVYSEAFNFGGQRFYLVAQCKMGSFGLCLTTADKEMGPFEFEIEFAARSKPAGEFVSKLKWSYTLTGGKAVGYEDMFAIPWTSFIGEDGVYFIDGALHLRAELTI